MHLNFIVFILLLFQNHLKNCLGLREVGGPKLFNATDVVTHPNFIKLQDPECGLSMSDRIIGGKNASLGQYPWIARIGYNKNGRIKYQCGGTLLTPDYVVTAGHCVAALPPGVELATVRLGEYNDLTEEDCDENDVCAEPHQDFDIAEVITHYNYVPEEFKNDMAIIKLDHAAELNGWVSTICALYGDLLTKDYVGQTGEVAGWGIVDIRSNAVSNILQTVKLPIISLNHCIQEFSRQAMVGYGQMCVGGTVGMDSCGGDSGGPLQKVEAYGTSPRYYFLGVVSFGAKYCGKSAKPAVYSNVANYMMWILDNIN